MDAGLSESPIGVFDSGAGGLSVLRELTRLMPGEDFIFFGDSLNAPYGTKSHDEVTQLSAACAEHLLAQGVKEIVIACNTATSVSAPYLRGRYTDIPIIGIEPALKPAVLEHPGGRVLVMATPLTLKEEKFGHLMEDYLELAQVVPVPCPELVEFVERGVLDGPEVEEYLADVLCAAGADSCDAVVLGCTHFPLLEGPIRRALKKGTAVYDGGAGTARQARKLLEEKGLLRGGPASGGRVVFQSSCPGKERYYGELYRRAFSAQDNAQ